MSHFFALSLLADSGDDNSMLLAAGGIVLAGLFGLVAGFLIGTRYGQMTGELKTLKSMRSGRSSTTRPKGRSSSNSDSSISNDQDN